MSVQNQLEINGRIILHPLAEVMMEIIQARLSGSLRAGVQTHKTIIYFKHGEVVFAVSNQRQHRVFEMLLSAGAVTKQQLVAIPEFVNDFALAKALQESGAFPESAVRAVFQQQIETIVRDCLSWDDGTWSFSPLARVKDDINFEIDALRILSEHVRRLPAESVTKRFKSFRETFSRTPVPPQRVDLAPQEAFLLSRFEQSTLDIEQIKALSGLSDLETLQRIYVLWLSGFLIRSNWDAGIPARTMDALKTARYEVKKQAPAPVPVHTGGQPVAAADPVAKTEEEAPQSVELTLETYLAQVEASETHYATLGIPPKADTAAIKAAYFNLAKRFHPDLFHKQTDAPTHKRIQHAFTEIAQAYETLRNEEARKTYDFKLRKLLAEMEKMSAADKAKPKQEQKLLTEAAEFFEQGFNLLMEEDFEQALSMLARAVAMAPTNAKYRAYYGKVLSADKNQRFKAEAELQMAIKTEPDNPSFRIMLAEFFVKYNLRRRAEGELKRLLALQPDNKDAKFLLDSLQQAS